MREIRILAVRLLVAMLLVLMGAGGCAKKVVDGPRIVVPDGGPQVIDHRVIEGETLASIADNYYGDPAQAGRIATQNGVETPDKILPGSILQLAFAPDEWQSARRRASALGPYNRGVDLLARERLGEAQRQFRLAADTAPELVAARYNLALVLMKRGHHTEALPWLEQLIDQRPRESDFRFAYGNALFQLTRFDEAAAQFRTITDRDPGHRRAAFSLARSLQEVGDAAAARVAWERYLVLDDSSSWATTARRHLQGLNDAQRP